MMDFQLHDYIAATLAVGSVLVFISLLCWNGYDDYRKGRDTSTWKKPEGRHG